MWKFGNFLALLLGSSFFEAFCFWVFEQTYDFLFWWFEENKLSFLSNFNSMKIGEGILMIETGRKWGFHLKLSSTANRHSSAVMEKQKQMTNDPSYFSHNVHHLGSVEVVWVTQRDSPEWVADGYVSETDIFTQRLISRHFSQFGKHQPSFASDGRLEPLILPFASKRCYR